MKTSIFLFLLFIGTYSLNAQKKMFFVGTTDSELAKSIVTCELDEENASMTLLSESEGGKRPGYITLSNDNKYLYAVSSAAFEGQSGNNSINAFALEDNGKALRKIATRSSMGENPCYISVNPVKQVAYTANYGSGVVTSYTIGADGVLSEPVSSIQHEGSGPNTDRQESPHAHYIHATNDGKYVYSADLGADKVMIYRQGTSGKLVPNESQTYLKIEPGSGPRHLAFHKNGKWLFVLTELSAQVISCAINEDGSLKIIDTGNALDSEISGNKSAAIRIHPNGKYLYCSNRGANTITLFEVDKNGKLHKKRSFDEDIGVVRDFNISPSGNYLIAGNQQRNELVLLRINSDGSLESTGSRISFSQPSCIVFPNN